MSRQMISNVYGSAGSPKKSRGPPQPCEFKVIALRECPSSESLRICDTPDKAAEYWRTHVKAHPYFTPEQECLTVLLVTARRRVKGHVLVSIGTLNSIDVHPREVFRPAIIGGAAAIVVMHNHPSGDPNPSEADIKTTRDLIRAGQLLKIEVLDHVIMGQFSAEQARDYVSLRELGYFYQ
ncbi:MAG: JAB domain-containing protein [Limisphaerales bacterium]